MAAILELTYPRTRHRCLAESDEGSQALTVMWRRIFRGTLSAACELTARTAACALCRPRGSYIIIMQHVPTHVRASESPAIVYPYAPDATSGRKKCQRNTSIETLRDHLVPHNLFQASIIGISLLIINNQILQAKCAIKI